MLQTKARVCIHIQGFGLTWHVLWCFISCLTQLGPFVDSKHEQIEVGCMCVVFFDTSCVQYLKPHDSRLSNLRTVLQKGQVTETFERIFSKCLDSIVEGTRGCVLHKLVCGDFCCISSFFPAFNSPPPFPPLSGQTVSWCLFHLSEMYITITFIPNRLSVSRT